MNEQKFAVYSYQRCVFIAAVFQSPKPFQRQKVSAAECHNRNGAMMLHKTVPCLDSHQLEEQHGFRAGRRLEERLLTTNFFLDRTLAANIPVWILSLALSKVFDRVDWNALCLDLSEHGVSTHML